MNVELQLRISLPVKSLSPITIPISAIITQRIDIKIVGNCKCSIKDGIADISVDAELTAANRWIPNKLVDFGKGAVKELILDGLIKPLKKKGVLLESEFKIDDEMIAL